MGTYEASITFKFDRTPNPANTPALLLMLCRTATDRTHQELIYSIIHEEVNVNSSLGHPVNVIPVETPF